MELMTKIDIPKSKWQIEPESKILLLGSCFADEIGKKMTKGGFQTLVNPFGTLYNPASIAASLQRCVDEKCIDEQSEEIIQDASGIWHSWMHHSCFSSTSCEDLVTKINLTTADVSRFLRDADILIVTLGTSIIYRLKENGMLVANCHKQLDSLFARQQMSVAEIVDEWKTLLHALNAVNPKMKILFTVSPIRHKRDGYHTNQVSKGTLLMAVDQLGVEYFPSYEIMMDELRDYRFYADDMIHPSEKAVEYIWQRFQDTYLNNKTKDIVAKAAKEWTRSQHRTIIVDSV